MPSTYTGSGIELIADGEQSGTWGQTTNTNLQIIDRMVSQAGTITLSGTTHTLTVSDGTLSDGQYGVLVFAGSPSGTNTVTISPNDAKRTFIVRNTTAQSVVLTQGSGGNVTITSNNSAIVYCTGVGAGSAVVNITSAFLTTSNIGTSVQAWDTNLDQIAALSVTDGNFIVGNGSAWVAENGATARTSLGLGTIATQAANSVSITGGSITGITDLAIADGGTGSSTAAGARTNLELGTAATLNVGTSANNIVQLNGSAQLPAVDGSLLTGIVAIPAGAILLWSGSTGTIPSGFVICDGTNGTPDLRDRFVVGAGNTYAVDATGGSNTVTLDTNTLPSHTHTGTTASDGAHTHNVSGNTSNSGTHTHTLSGNTSNTGAHTHSGSTSNTGAHTHTASFSLSNTFIIDANASPLPDRQRQNLGDTGSAGAHSHNFTTNSDGAHSHTLSGNAAAGGDHSHTVSGTADSAGAHTHTFTTASTGGGGAHENRPPYYALAYIMKT